MLNNKTILITGGTFILQKCTEIILKKEKTQTSIIYSRDELKQFEMDQQFPI